MLGFLIISFAILTGMCGTMSILAVIFDMTNTWNYSFKSMCLFGITTLVLILTSMVIYSYEH